MQKIGENQVQRYKVELLKRMTDLEDVAAWLVVWGVPVGTLVMLLRGNRPLDFEQGVFVPVFEAGISGCVSTFVATWYYFLPFAPSFFCFSSILCERASASTANGYHSCLLGLYAYFCSSIVLCAYFALLCLRQPELYRVMLMLVEFQRTTLSVLIRKTPLQTPFRVCERGNWFEAERRQGSLLRSGSFDKQQVFETQQRSVAILRRVHRFSIRQGVKRVKHQVNNSRYFPEIPHQTMQVKTWPEPWKRLSWIEPKCQAQTKSPFRGSRSRTMQTALVLRFQEHCQVILFRKTVFRTLLSVYLWAPRRTLRIRRSVHSLPVQWCAWMKSNEMAIPMFERD